MKLIVVIFAIIGTVYANCGCLKCSKHLAVAGSVPGAPGQAPIKVIYRGDKGFSRDAGLIGGCLAVQPTVQVPAPAVEVSTALCGKEIPVTIQQFYSPVSCDVHGGRRMWDRNLLGCGGLVGCSYPEFEEGLLTNVGEYGILPVEVQIPEQLPAASPVCTPIEGLTTCIDRVVVPAPSFVCGKAGKPANPVISTCCGPITCPAQPVQGCGLYYPNFNAYPAPVASSPLCGCASRYESISSDKNVANSSCSMHNRSKRQLPIVQNGYKFMINMLPKFMKEPIMKTVNSMALTHPDKKLQAIYNVPPPQLSLQEKISQKHQENMALVKSKIFGKPALKQLSKQYANNYGVEERYLSKKKDDDRYRQNDNIPSHAKYYRNKSPLNAYVTERLVDEETEHFIDSLHYPKSKNLEESLKQRLDLEKPQWNAKTRFSKNQFKRKDESWMREISSKEILEDYFNENSIEEGMSAREKARFLHKLETLNKAHSLSKRSTNNINSDSTKKEKRSIIIDSEELSLPLYQIRIKDSDEDNEIDSDYDYENSEEDYIVSSHNKNIMKEEVLRRAIREELQRFKEDNSDESEDLEIAPPFKKEWISKYPLLHVLSVPAKVLHSLNDKDAFPIVKAVPKMLVGTKRYFKNFGHNFKKNLLHFTSDMIGDFEDYTPTDHFLDNLVKRRRLKRDLSKNTETNTFKRKKRYILKTVDDDEIERMLKEKLGRMVEDPDKVKRKFRAKHNKIENSDEQRKIVEHLYGGLKKQIKSSAENHSENVNRRRNNAKHKSKKMTSHEESIEQIRRKIVIEPIRPKLIIDNNGLPFMEVNGYKRPMFMKRGKNKGHEKNSIENSSLDPFDSSEEGNLDKINHVINRAKGKNNFPNRNTEIPVQAVKEHISQLLTDIDVLIYMDCKKFDQIYDDLSEIHSIKKSIVQSWKRLIMDKQTNDYEAKIGLLEKFTELQEMKNTAMKNILHKLHEEKQNAFAVKKLTGDLASLQKIQCIINQVVDCFQEKFKTGAKFDVLMEIKYVDFLSSLKFLKAKTRNEMVQILEYERDVKLQEKIQLLEKLKRLLVEDDDNLIEEEANILWEMKHVQNMQVSTIEEMADRLESGLKIKKCLKILFDLQRRLAVLEEKEKKVCSGSQKSQEDESEEKSDEASDEKEDSKKLKEVNKVSSKKKTKYNMEEFKKKWQKKVEKHKHLVEDNYKKRIDKLKELKKILNSSEENE